MNEWLLAQWNRLRRKVDRIVVGALVVLLGVMGFLYWTEQQLPKPTVPPLVKVPVNTPPAEWEVFKKRFVHPKEIRKSSDLQLRGLLDYNMFDPRSVSIQTDLTARLDKLFEKAQEAFLKNDLATAERICNDIINQMSSHRNTVELLNLISSKRKEQEKTPPKTP